MSAMSGSSENFLLLYKNMTLPEVYQRCHCRIATDECFCPQSCLSREDKENRRVSPLGEDRACDISLVTTSSLPPAPDAHPAGLEHFPLPTQTHSGPEEALLKPGSTLDAPYQSKGMWNSSYKPEAPSDDEVSILCPPGP